jgi:hypothetical protein
MRELYTGGVFIALRRLAGMTAPIKQKYAAALVFTAFACFFNPSIVFSQQSEKIKDIADGLDKVSEDISGAIPFAASIGLNWPDVYIGPLIDIPAHYGIGLTLGTTMLKLNHLNPLLKRFGYETDEDFMYRQLLPAYTIETRIGGARLVPFDIGIKWGWLPYTEIFKNSINYESCIYGIDFRWEVVKDVFRFPAMSIGLEVDHATGGLRRETVVSLSDEAGDTIGVNGGNAGVVWDSWVFDLKLHLAKKFWEPRLTVYGGLRLGVAITKTGYQLSGGDDITFTESGSSLSTKLNDLSKKKRSELMDKLGADSGKGITFEVTEDSISGWLSTVGFNLNMYEGVSFNFDNNTHLSISLMTDLVHFELGANIGFRFQQ